MANIKSAKKRAITSEKRRIRNVNLRSRFRTALKKVVSLIDAGNKAEAKVAYDEAAPLIDGAVTKGLIHKNKAARHKSRLNTKIKAL
ncbi:MAG: 30S ribosomal protein S20 [Gammaproteobacteria bacterium]|nr:30S ribosomal protein S20 [Gammaproteobacteria bacterium]NNC97674.1 30S ribosomal protein S20 [Gammaproteobacteria bacterium]NNM12850.1 30S ribosomal protein S20 [Gammaproteobacteria bacterium]